MAGSDGAHSEDCRRARRATYAANPSATDPPASPIANPATSGHDPDGDRDAGAGSRPSPGQAGSGCPGDSSADRASPGPTPERLGEDGRDVERPADGDDHDDRPRRPGAKDAQQARDQRAPRRARRPGPRLEVGRGLEQRAAATTRPRQPTPSATIGLTRPRRGPRPAGRRTRRRSGARRAAARADRRQRRRPDQADGDAERRPPPRTAPPGRDAGPGRPGAGPRARPGAPTDRRR